MLLWGMSCVKAQTSDVDKMFPNVVLTRENYDKVKTALEKALKQSLKARLKK